MISSAKARYVRMSPTKVRYVIDQIRSKPVSDALDILMRSNRRAATPVRKLVLSAIDNAKQKKNETQDRLVISKIYADGAGIMKRWRAMTMGRAGSIHKHLSHVTIELSLKPGVSEKKEEAPVKKAVKKGRKTAGVKA